jgi:mannose-6-phosphate isomerase-like protein (cupin superfamily)
MGNVFGKGHAQIKMGRTSPALGKENLMHLKRFSDAKPYEAPNHRNYTSLRLFGAEAGGTKGLVFGYSHFLPGGGAGPDASPPEKVYFVLRGELTVIVNGKETVLKANDSCVIEPNETREIINRGNEVCSIVVAVATPPK